MTHQDPIVAKVLQIASGLTDTSEFANADVEQGFDEGLAFLLRDIARQADADALGKHSVREASDRFNRKHASRPAEYHFGVKCAAYYCLGIIQAALAPVEFKQRGSKKRAEVPAGVEIIKRPMERFKDVIGLEKAKDELETSILLSDPKIQKLHGVDPVNGVLLYGPPGTGKTFFARAAAGEFDHTFIKVDTTAMESKYHGESEKNLKKVFAYARGHTPCIMFFDEFDRIARKRGTSPQNPWYDTIVNALLEELQGLGNDQRKPIVLAATNFKENLDRAVLRPGRFDTVIKVGLPNAGARKEFLKRALRGRVDPEDRPDLARWVKATQGWSGAFLVEWIDAVRRKLVKEDPKKPRPIYDRDLQSLYDRFQERMQSQSEDYT